MVVFFVKCNRKIFVEFINFMIEFGRNEVLDDISEDSFNFLLVNEEINFRILLKNIRIRLFE